MSLRGRSVHEIGAVRAQDVLEKDIEIEDIAMIQQTQLLTFDWLEYGVEQSPRIKQTVVSQCHEK